MSNFTFSFLNEKDNLPKNVSIESEDKTIRCDCKELIFLTDSVQDAETLDIIVKDNKYKCVLHLDLLNQKLDLISGKYEGGGKIWECAIDLTSYLQSINEILSVIPSSNNEEQQEGEKYLCIELGCGHGLPGICALNLGYYVYFSDFNSDILERVTWNNVKSNCQPEVVHKARYFAGDWEALSDKLITESCRFDISYLIQYKDVLLIFEISRKFHLILSAETLYTSQSCDKIAKFIEMHLSPEGQAFVASKKYYFGVGGGTTDFIHRVNSGGQLFAEVVETFSDGKSNIREILRLRHLSNC